MRKPSGTPTRMGCSFIARPMEPLILSLRMRKACWGPSLPITIFTKLSSPMVSVMSA